MRTLTPGRTLIHHRLSPSRQWHSFYRTPKDGKLGKFWWKKGQTNYQTSGD